MRKASGRTAQAARASSSPGAQPSPQLPTVAPCHRPAAPAAHLSRRSRSAASASASSVRRLIGEGGRVSDARVDAASALASSRTRIRLAIVSCCSSMTWANACSTEKEGENNGMEVQRRHVQMCHTQRSLQFCSCVHPHPPRRTCCHSLVLPSGRPPPSTMARWRRPTSRRMASPMACRSCRCSASRAGQEGGGREGAAAWRCLSKPQARQACSSPDTT